MLHYEVVLNAVYKGNLINSWTCVMWGVVHLCEHTVGNPLLLFLVMAHCTISVEMITVVCPTFWHLWTLKMLLESSTRILCMSLVCFPMKLTLNPFDVRSLIITCHFLLHFISPVLCAKLHSFTPALTARLLHNLTHTSSFIGAVAKVQKATVSFLMSVCLSICQHRKPQPPLGGF